MAIYYCDIYSGSDSNNGLTTSTPKLSINAATALYTSAGDSVRVRGYDNLYTEYTGGTIWWRNGSTSLTGSTNLGLSVGDFIYKSTDTLPDIYKIASTGWTGSVYTLGLTLNAGNYEGTTEDCYIRKINPPALHQAVQTFNKAGGVSGTAGTWYARTGTTISGGWDESYTSRTGWTLLFSTGTTGTAFNINQSNWDCSYFMVIGYGLSFTGMNQSNSHHLVSAWHAGIVNMYAYSSLMDCVFNHQKSVDPAFKTGTCYVKNVTVRGGSLVMRGQSYAVDMNDCTFSNSTAGISDVLSASVWRNCKFLQPATTYVFYSSGNYVLSGCTIRTNTNLFEDGGYNSSVLAFNNNFTGTLKSIRHNGTYVNNGMTSIYGQIRLPGNFQVVENTSNSFSATLGAAPLWNVTPSTYYCPTNSVDYNSPEYTTTYINVKQKDAIYNINFYNTASVQGTGVTYSGSTGLKVLQYSSSYIATAGTVEFFITSGISYNYSFYAKSSSASPTLYHKFYVNEYPIGDWNSTTVNNSTWTECTGTLESQSNSSVIKLFLKFNIGTNGYVYANNFSITPTS